MPTRRLLPYGDRARLLECDDLADSQAVQHWLEGQHRPEITGIVPGARTLLLQLAGSLPTDLVRTMIDIELPAVTTTDVGLITIDVSYDGPDLAGTADRLGIEVEDLITHHTGQEWTVAFCGFSPGFGYLSPTRQQLTVPRRDSPRTRVPAGSVALADHWSAVYPTQSPGGWQLIGSTDATLFDVDADPPAVLLPGTRVRFRRLES
jgi:KipI family sensor histidine kinase inhibitor